MLHLVTQEGQLYGSVRNCCEICGTASGPYWPGCAGSTGNKYTSDIGEWQLSRTNCLKMHNHADISRVLQPMTDQQRDIGLGYLTKNTKPTLANLILDEVVNDTIDSYQEQEQEQDQDSEAFHKDLLSDEVRLKKPRKD